jgi:large subunit ribosomal protein L32e
MEIKKLIEHKQKVKSSKPKFRRQELHKRKRLADVWRKPRGVHSKMRLRRRGKAVMVSVGYKMPEKVRGLTKQGLSQVMVSSPEHIKFIQSGEIAIIRKVSNRKRLAILEAAKIANVAVLNFNDVSKKIDEIKVKLHIKKEARKEKETKRAKKQEDEKKKAKMSTKQAEKTVKAEVKSSLETKAVETETKKEIKKETPSKSKEVKQKEKPKEEVKKETKLTKPKTETKAKSKTEVKINKLNA